MMTILFIDSGMGGLPYCRNFLKRLDVIGKNAMQSRESDGCDVLYLADRAHFPYGTKTKEELAHILCSHMETLDASFHPAMVVLACNTASVSALETLRERFPGISFVGTVPAVKPAVERSALRSVGILGTERTIADPCIDELAARYGPDCSIHKIAAPELALFVEGRYENASAAERLETAGHYVERFRLLGADAVVLGCTHFLFLLDEFRTAARAAHPALTIYDSVDGVSARAEALLCKKAAFPAVKGKRLLLLSGKEEPGPLWEKRAGDFGMEAALLGDFA